MTKTTKAKVSRRAVLAAGAAAMVVPRHVLGGVGFQAPSDKLRIAAIGVGGVGQDYVAGCKSEEIVALCDLDHQLCGPVFELYPKAKTYKDFRLMFDKEAKNFDALIIATPDHWHSHLILAGLAMNKHLYCDKPMTRTIAEARRVKAAVLASKVTTKASIQDSRSSAARDTTELLLSGAIGPVHEVHFWTGTHCPSGLSRPKDVEAPPEGMNWDQWCGPSPARPFNKLYHYGNWRPWWDFGTGNLGDVACHALHVFFEELQMGAPDWVAADACQAFSPAGTVANWECASICNYVQWHFPARGKHPENDGLLLRRRPATAAAVGHVAVHGDAGQGHDVRRREGRSGLRLLWRQQLAARPYRGPARPADPGVRRRLAPAGGPFPGLQTARTDLAALRAERTITPSGSGPARPARSRSCPSSSPAT